MIIKKVVSMWVNVKDHVLYKKEIIMSTEVK